MLIFKFPKTNENKNNGEPRRRTEADFPSHKRMLPFLALAYDRKRSWSACAKRVRSNGRGLHVGWVHRVGLANLKYGALSNYSSLRIKPMGDHVELSLHTNPAENP